jgi:hypothetical protein
MRIKQKIQNDQDELRERAENKKWAEGVNIRQKAKVDRLLEKTKRAEKKRQDKKSLEENEAVELQRIKQQRAMKGRSKSLSSEPLTPRPRRGRSHSMDLTMSPDLWKSVPSHNKSANNRAKVKISVVTMNGDDTILTMPKNSTVWDVKLKVQALRGVPAISQELMSPKYNSDKPLVDSQTLKDLGLRNNATIYCQNNAGTLDQFATFQHFRSPNKPKKHIEFTDDDRTTATTATKVSAHPKATYVYTAGSVSAHLGDPARSWDMKLNSLNEKEGRICIGLFHGRDLKMDEDPIPKPTHLQKKNIEWGSTNGVGALNTQSPIWCVSTDGRYKTPDVTGFMSFVGNEPRSVPLVREGDTVRVTLQPGQSQIEFHIAAAPPPVEADNAPSQAARPESELEPPPPAPEFELWYTLPLGLTVRSCVDDLHLFATLQSQGDSVSILASS